MLQRWDPVAGTYAVVGTGSGFGNLRDGAIDGHGDYYLLSASGNLVRVNLTTGVGTVIVAGTDGLALVAPR